MSKVVSPAQFLLVEPLLPYFFAVTPWTPLNTSGDIYSGASASVCSFVATILQEASWQTDGRSAAAFHKLLNLLHICVSPGRIFPSSGFDILQDELHAAVLKRFFKSLRAIVLVMLHLANSTNKYRSSWKRTLNLKECSCGSVVEHCISSAKGCGFNSQGTHILIKKKK